MYERYCLREWMAVTTEGMTRLGQVRPPAVWLGDPMAALYRSFKACGSLVARGIPQSKFQELQELLSLYRRNDAAISEDVASSGAEYRTGILGLSGDQHPVGQSTVSSGTNIGRTEPSGADPPFTRTTLPDATETATQVRLKIASSCILSSGSTLINSDTSGAAMSADMPKAAQRAVSKSLQREQQNMESGMTAAIWQWGPGATCQNVVDFYTAVRKLRQRD